MKIFHVLCYNREKASGIANALVSVLKEQTKKNDVLYFNIREYPLPNIPELQYRGSLQDLLNSESKPDLIIFHEIFRPEYIKIYKKILNRIPYIIVPHGSLNRYALKKKFLKKRLGLFLLFNKFIDNASAIQYVSEFEYQESNRGQMVIISSNPVTEQNRISPTSSQGKIFAYIGRFEINIKGLDLLLLSVARLAGWFREGNHSVRLYGPSHKNSAKEIDDMIKFLNISDIVTVLPPVYKSDKIKVLHDIDVFIQVSRTEGMPMGILEALSYGIPVLVTYGTALGEFVESTKSGWACETSIEGIGEALKRSVLEQDNWNQISINAWKSSQEFFNIEYIVQQQINDYMRIVENFIVMEN